MDKTEMIKASLKTDNDYIGVLDYLNNNRNIPYSKPENADSKLEEKRLVEIKEKGKKALYEMKKMFNICEKMFRLDKCEPMSWLDGSNTKTRKYLWAQMKYKKYSHSPISISIFAELSDETNKTRYRFSLEIKNDKADEKQMEIYHSYLDLPIKAESSLVYVSGSNEFGAMKVINESVEGIKQKIKDGTYKKVQICRVQEWTDNLTNDECEKVMIEAVEELIPYYRHVLEIEKVAEEIEEMDSSNIDTKIINFDKNLILYGPPGTGKTYNAAIYSVAICDNKSVEELTDYDAVMERYNELKKEQRIIFTTFHQSYGYEEFIEGIKPVVFKDQSNDSGNVVYKIEPGIFKKFCEVAKKSKVRTDKFEIQEDATIWEANEKPYVFVIDEINRGNISKIFGELITLIENTKREGMPEAANAVLPYSGDLFSVPKNVYILGTMNTADRSIALMDTALRRRFSFSEMMPNTDILRSIGADKIGKLNVADMLDVINERIAFLYDREHTIGHAFFTGLKDDTSIERLQCIFEKSVIPLLQEYFYEDYQKIQTILGDNGKEDSDLKFIKDEKVVAKSIFKGNVEDVIDLPEKKYSINKKAMSNIQSYIEIM